MTECVEPSESRFQPTILERKLILEDSGIAEIIHSVRMKISTPSKVNISRGAIVDEGALLAALQERRIAGAALDVLGEGAAPPPPPPPDHPLFSLDNVQSTFWLETPC